MTYDELKQFDGKSVRMTKKSGAVYLGTVRQIKDVGGGQFKLVDAKPMIRGTENVWAVSGGFSDKENRKVWLSKVESIQLENYSVQFVFETNSFALE
jgi:hypothetical protein